MGHDYDKVYVVVITYQHELHMYYKLMRLMCEGNLVALKESKNECLIETEKVKIRFFVKPESPFGVKGIRAHYVLNLTQDKEFNDEILIPMTTIRTLLDKDKFGL